MPVILPRDTWPAWLGEKPAEPAALVALLIPYPSDDLAAWPVPWRVGSVREDDARLAEPDVTAPPVAGLDDRLPEKAA
jgi:putative SOS response-associated peptidase YedK